MTGNFLSGSKIVVQSFPLLFKKGIKRFVLIPLSINIGVFAVAIWLGFTFVQRLISALSDNIPNWLHWIEWLIWPLVIIMGLVILYFTFTVVANLIAAPFNALLAERTEAILRGQTSKSNQGYSKIPSMITRTMWSEFRKILYQLKWIVGLLIISFIPGINLTAPILWILFGGWMLAVNYVDYPMGNHDFYFAEVKKKLKQDRSGAMGFGLIMMLITMIPIVNFIAMPLGVVSATNFWVAHLDHREQTLELETTN